MISVLIPTFNGAKFIRPTLDSILNQSFTDFELVINDDCSTDDTLKIIKAYRDQRIKISINKKNLGYTGNLEQGRTKIKGEYLFLMGQDDILAPNTLQKYFDIFSKNPKIGAITRPYYWFFNNTDIPVRHKVSFNSSKTEYVKITDKASDVIRIFDSLDQLSGLAYRVKFMTTPFHPDVFPCHIYPFASIFKNHPIAYVSDYNTAVRIASSQTRFLSSIYNKSPIQSWVDMVNSLKLPRYLISDFIAVNYVGLVQIKNYSSFSNLLREIYLLLKYRPKNIFSPSCWLFSLGTIIAPPIILIPLVDWYKNKIYKNILQFNLFKFIYHSKFFSRLFPTTVYCLQNALADSQSVLDLGCGPDSPLQYCKNIKKSVGVDAFLPYINQSKSKKIHQRYINKNINNVDFKNNSFDSVILIETLEHLSFTDGQNLLKKCQKWARKNIIITTPNGYIHQKSLDKNKYQQHKSGWTPELFTHQNFKVHGLSGLKTLRAEGTNQSMSDSFLTTIKYRPKSFWFIIATISQAITYRLPKLAFEIFAVYKVGKT